MTHSKLSIAGIARSLIATLLLTLSFGAARAEVMVLVHGFLGDGLSFERAGVIEPLKQTGWRFGSVGSVVPGGVVIQPIPNPGPKTIYSVDLPSQAPVVLQADTLQAYLMQISAYHPSEPINLVAHSAGGVVARLALVRYGAGHVVRLATIASPHLGTYRANQAMDATSGGGFFSPIKNFFVQRSIGSGNYNLLGVSRPILADLTTARPGNFLGWLAVQPHPDIDYISIIRANTYTMAQDIFVPSQSQDMNLVPALAGRSRRIVTADQHFLNPRDGVLLAQLFDR